jgi:hypothetical protein
MKNMIAGLKLADIKEKNIDVASVVTIDNDDELKRTLSHRKGKVFAGTSDARASNCVAEGFYPRFTGVTQDRTKYSPVPVKLTENIKQTGKRGFMMSEAEYRQIFDLSDYESGTGMYEKVKDKRKADRYKKRDNEPLSPEEERALQENINKAREDTNTLVKELLKEVWNVTE